MTENRVFLIGWLAYIAIVAVVAFLIGPDWMNWGGWHWISMPYIMFVGACVGWSIRGTHERSKRWKAELDAMRERRT
jgi:hypothetical protein